jgi:hypothetical protein
MKLSFWASVGAMVYLTFVWPFAHTNDPWFKPAAIAVFTLFFVSLAAILACKVRRTSS